MREDKIVEHAAAMGPVLKRMLTDLGEGIHLWVKFAISVCSGSSNW
jgi:hypothetical protein